MRSGTLPHPLVVGIGAACEIAGQEMTYDLEHVRRLSKRLINGITSQLDFVVRNGDPEMTYEGIFFYSDECAVHQKCFFFFFVCIVNLYVGNVYSTDHMSKIVFLAYCIHPI